MEINMRIDEITSKWEEAAKSDEAQGHIHPSGSISAEEYERSGRDAAAVVCDIARTYLAHKVPDIRVADFGCGDGRVLKHVSHEFDDVWGIDASPTMLERLSDRVPGVQKIESNGTDAQMLILRADLIYSWAVFIHHDIKAGSDMIMGLSEGLNPGGLLALQIPCYDEPRERGAWIDVTVWTPKHIRTAAGSSGLQVVELWNSEGQFSYDNIGKHHNRLQVFRKS
jgi:trans-aconitate methyltransferase